MRGQKTNVVDAGAGKAVKTRQRSAIAFPYMDLTSAVEMATAIHAHVGVGECDDDQLAAWTDQSAKSSTFRVQVYAARTFGVLEGEGGKHRLSELGRALVDPKRERKAKVDAFLTVPLYKAVFDKYRGGVLPPAAALERDFVSLGVSEKQKERARQIFERAAEQAGFSEQGKNRLVMPGVASGRDSLRDNQKPSGGGGGNGDGGGSETDPVIAALIQKLPPSGTDWPVGDRVNWLRMVAMAFQMAYGQKEIISVTSTGEEPR